MQKQVHLLDEHHWQVKRCVSGSLCEACSLADISLQPSVADHLSQAIDDSQPLTSSNIRPLTYVAGVDISFVKNDAVNACAAFIVVKLPDFEVCIVHDIN